jgi:hypothetical protein
MSEMTFKRIANILISLLCLTSYEANANNFAQDTIHIEYKKPIELTISGDGINRISLAPMIATSIWGNSSEYAALISNNGSELFLSSKVETGKSFALTVELAGGRVVDLLLHTLATSMPKIVHLNLADQSFKQHEHRLEVEQLIKAMQSGRKGKYYVVEEGQKLNLPSKLFGKQSKIYKYGDLSGVILQLTNKGKGELLINARELANSFNNVIAVQLINERLKAGDSTNAFLVLKNGGQS